MKQQSKYFIHKRSLTYVSKSTGQFNNFKKSSTKQTRSLAFCFALNEKNHITLSHYETVLN